MPVAVFCNRGEKGKEGKKRERGTKVD